MTNVIVLKDKFSYLFDGYEKFFLVDDKENILDVDKMIVKNIYLWKCAKPGDKVEIAVAGSRINIIKIN